MKKAFYLFISVLLVLFSTNKVNDARTIKRANEQTNKQEIILSYSSNDPSSDIYLIERTQGNQTARAKISSTFKINIHRRYIIALRSNNPDTFIDPDSVFVVLMGWSNINQMSGQDVFNHMQSGNYANYELILNTYLGKSSQEGGYYTYYLNLSAFGNNNNITEMQMSLTQQGTPNTELNAFIQDIYVYDITNITTQGETWYNYKAGGIDPTEIQTAYDKGYDDAIKSGTGLNWLQSAFNMITNILNIELLPNIKLAYLVAIPLLIELILFVLRFIK